MSTSDVDVFKEFLWCVSQNQHVGMHRQNPILVILKNVVDYPHPLAYYWRGSLLTTESFAEDIGPLRTWWKAFVKSISAKILYVWILSSWLRMSGIG